MNIRNMALSSLLGVVLVACEPAVNACAVAAEPSNYEKIKAAFAANPDAIEVTIYTGTEVRRIEVLTGVKTSIPAAIRPHAKKIKDSRDWYIKWLTNGTLSRRILRVR